VLQSVIAPEGILYKADGIVHTEDRRKSVSELAKHIQDRYKAYKHLSHDEFCLAVDEENNTAYLGVRYVMQNIGNVAGHEATGRPSSGVLLEKLELDDEALIKSALVCRQMTPEEASSLTYDPERVHAPPLSDELLFAPKESLNGDDVAIMRNNAIKWVHSWDTGADLSELDQIVTPDIKQVNGYGLSKRSEPFSDITEARNMISSSWEHYPGNTDSLMGVAISDERRAGFSMWQAASVLPQTGSPEVQTGLDYMRFDKDGRVKFVLSFTMRPYSNVRHNAPRGDRVD